MVIQCDFLARVILSITNEVALHNSHDPKNLEDSMDDSDEEWDKPESPVIGIICNKSPPSKKENTTIKSPAVGGRLDLIGFLKKLVAELRL